MSGDDSPAATGWHMLYDLCAARVDRLL